MPGRRLTEEETLEQEQRAIVNRKQATKPFNPAKERRGAIDPCEDVVALTEAVLEIVRINEEVITESAQKIQQELERIKEPLRSLIAFAEETERDCCQLQQLLEANSQLLLEAASRESA
jgi:ribosomal protein S18